MKTTLSTHVTVDVSEVTDPDARLVLMLTQTDVAEEGRREDLFHVNI